MFALNSFHDIFLVVPLNSFDHKFLVKNKIKCNCSIGH